MNAAKQLGEKVRQSRMAKGWSQEDLANATGLHRTYVSGIERGIRNPTLSIICKVAKALGVKPHELLKELGQ